MAPAGLHRLTRRSAVLEQSNIRCPLIRPCPVARRLCAAGPLPSPACSVSLSLSRRHTPSIRAWSGGASLNTPVVNTASTERRPATTKSARLRVAVDVDEVLGRFVFALNQFCKDHYGMEYKVGDYWIYEFAKIWHCSQERSNEIVHEFFKSQHFTDGIPVIPGALEALTRLSGADMELVVVTSRQHVIQDVTLDWLDRHYGGLFRTIGAQVLIDDNPSYATECAAAGIRVLLYDWQGAYPWSKLPTSGVRNRELITVVRDWAEVEAALAELAPSLAAAAPEGGHAASNNS
eukprot:XP_001697943.1 predicted protein [Chlamydomonas reinhardtii]